MTIKLTTSARWAAKFQPFQIFGDGSGAVRISGNLIGLIVAAGVISPRSKRNWQQKNLGDQVFRSH